MSREELVQKQARNSREGAVPAEVHRCRRRQKIFASCGIVGSFLVEQTEKKESVKWSSLGSVFVKMQLFCGNVSKSKMGKWETIIFWLSHFTVIMSNCYICASENVSFWFPHLDLDFSIAAFAIVFTYFCLYIPYLYWLCCRSTEFLILQKHSILFFCSDLKR